MKVAFFVPELFVAATCPVVVPGIIKTFAVLVELEIRIAVVPFTVMLLRVDKSKLVPVIVSKVPTGPLVGFTEMLGGGFTVMLIVVCAEPPVCVAVIV